MSDERPSDVLGGLPRTRPHRRSLKRAASPAAGAKPEAVASAPRPRGAAPGATKRATPQPSRVRQPAQPPGTPPAAGAPPTSPRPPASPGTVDLIGSAVHVTAELAEIGISAGARALRGFVARLPKP